jgi:hypothetical protein
MYLTFPSYYIVNPSSSRLSFSFKSVKCLMLTFFWQCDSLFGCVVVLTMRTGIFFTCNELFWFWLLWGAKCCFPLMGFDLFCHNSDFADKSLSCLFVRTDSCGYLSVCSDCAILQTAISSISAIPHGHHPCSLSV